MRYLTFYVPAFFTSHTSAIYFSLTSVFITIVLLKQNYANLDLKININLNLCIRSQLNPRFGFCSKTRYSIYYVIFHYVIFCIRIFKNIIDQIFFILYLILAEMNSTIWSSTLSFMVSFCETPFVV